MFIYSLPYSTFATQKLNTKKKKSIMLKTILSISGKPGLYQLVSQGKNMMIIESLAEKKRIPAYAKDKVISLGDIAIYTDSAEVPLHEVLTSLKEKENGEKASIKPNTSPDDLRKYFAGILPDFDRERVYPSDIKKLIGWYNTLIEAGITDFAPKAVEKETPEETETTEETEKE